MCSKLDKSVPAPRYAEAAAPYRVSAVRRHAPPLADAIQCREGTSRATRVIPMPDAAESHPAFTPVGKSIRNVAAKSAGLDTAAAERRASAAVSIVAWAPTIKTAEGTRVRSLRRGEPS
jgi:hypothetical protein